MHDGRGVKRGIVRGVGINDADYQVTSVVDGKRWMCPYYRVWSNMLNRCYGSAFKETCSSYLNNHVNEDWFSFMNFKSWMEPQAWEDLELDKDILVRGNLEYGPNTCAFVPRYINTLLLIRPKSRNDLPIGVTYQTKSKRMVSERAKPYSAKVSCVGGADKYLGYFGTKEEAHSAWQLGKAEQIERYVDMYRKDFYHDRRIEVALLERANILRLDSKDGKQTFKL